MGQLEGGRENGPAVCSMVCRQHTVSKAHTYSPSAAKITTLLAPPDLVVNVHAAYLTGNRYHQRNAGYLCGISCITGLPGYNYLLPVTCYLAYLM